MVSTSPTVADSANRKRPSVALVFFGGEDRSRSLNSVLKLGAHWLKIGLHINTSEENANAPSLGNVLLFPISSWF